MERGKAEATHEGPCLERHENKGSPWGSYSVLESGACQSYKRLVVALRGKCDRKSDE